MLAHLKIKNVENCEEHTKSLVWVQINSAKYSASSFKMFPERSVSCKALVKHPISFKAVFLSVFFIETWMLIMKTCNKKKYLNGFWTFWWFLGFIKTSDNQYTDHRRTYRSTTYHLPTDPPTTYPQTCQLAISNLC